VQKTVHEKNKSAARESERIRFLSLHFFIFRAVFRAALQLTERLKEAKSADSLQNTALLSSVTQSIFVV